MSPALAVGFLTTAPPGKYHYVLFYFILLFFFLKKKKKNAGCEGLSLFPISFMDTVLVHPHLTEDWGRAVGLLTASLVLFPHMQSYLSDFSRGAFTCLSYSNRLGVT